jgi:hypothetical protein
MIELCFVEISYRFFKFLLVVEPLGRDVLSVLEPVRVLVLSFDDPS